MVRNWRRCAARLSEYKKRNTELTHKYQTVFQVWWTRRGSNPRTSWMRTVRSPIRDRYNGHKAGEYMPESNRIKKERIETRRMTFSLTRRSERGASFSCAESGEWPTRLTGELQPIIQILKNKHYKRLNYEVFFSFSHRISSNFPSFLASYVTAVAQSTQTPVDMAGTVAISILSTCLQGKYRIPGKPDWIEPLNTYALVIAAPSERKSAVTHVMVRPLNDYETQYRVQLWWGAFGLPNFLGSQKTGLLI